MFLATTIKDIAKMAGVSAATVSRVLANKEGFFGSSTAKKVREAAAKLGYRKNTSATELVTRKSHDLAVIVNATKTNFSNHIIDGIQAAAFPKDLNVIILYAGDFDAERQRRAINTAVNRSVMGILLLSVEVNDDNLDLLKSAQIPFCFLSISETDESLPFITSDDEEVGYLATKYLYQQGHRNIGIAGINYKNAITGELRLHGYKRALKEFKLQENTDWISAGDYSYESGELAMSTYGRNTKLTGIIAGSDMAAIGIMNQARSLGLSVPDDISIVAIDGTELCEIVQPQLTSVSQSFYEMGTLGVDWLLNKDKKVTKTITPIKVIERQSVKRLTGKNSF